MIELIFQKGLMLIKQIYRKNVSFAAIGILKMFGFKYESYFCNGCHDLMQKAISFNNIVVVYVKRNVYRINFKYVSKDDAINIMNGSNLDDKRGVL